MLLYLNDIFFDTRHFLIQYIYKELGGLVNLHDDKPYSHQFQICYCQIQGIGGAINYQYTYFALLVLVQSS